VPVPTLFVTGDAEREVVPDRVVVSVSVPTNVLRTLQEALSRAAEARRRPLDDLTSTPPDSAVADGRIRFEVGAALGRRVRDALEKEAVGDALARARGLATAAGMAVGPLVSIGEYGPEPPGPRDDDYTTRAFADMPAPMGAGKLQDALGELRPEPVTRTASVPVRLALVDR
jgi:uncharacterized protein YggE